MTQSGARRLNPEERKEQLLDFAVRLAEEHGYNSITSTQIATSAGLQSHGLISHYFGSIDSLRTQVLARAIQKENIEVLLQGLVRKDPLAMGAPKRLRDKALEQLASE